MKKIAFFAFFSILHAFTIKEPLRLYSGKAQEETINHMPFSLGQDELALVFRYEGRYLQLLASKKEEASWPKVQVVSDWEKELNGFSIFKHDQDLLTMAWSKERNKNKYIRSVTYTPNFDWDSFEALAALDDNLSIVAVFPQNEHQMIPLVNTELLSLDGFLKEVALFATHKTPNLFYESSSVIADCHLRYGNFYIELSKEGSGFIVYPHNDQLFFQRIFEFKPFGTKEQLTKGYYDLDNLTFFEKNNTLESVAFIADCSKIVTLKKAHNLFEESFTFELTKYEEPSINLIPFSNESLATCLIQENKEGSKIRVVTQEGLLASCNMPFDEPSLIYTRSGFLIFGLIDERLYVSNFDYETLTFDEPRALEVGLSCVKSIHCYQNSEHKALMTIMTEDNQNNHHVDLIEITP